MKKLVKDLYLKWLNRRLNNAVLMQKMYYEDMQGLEEINELGFRKKESQYIYWRKEVDRLVKKIQEL